MTRRLVVVLLLAAAAVILVLVVPEARQERDAARRDFEVARAEREQLRVRLADLSPRSSNEHQPTAAEGAVAVRALRGAVLAATDGLAVSGVEIAMTSNARGLVAAHGRLVAEGPYVDVLRLARRLASASSGVLLERVSLGDARGRVRIEADAFIMKEAP